MEAILVKMGLNMYARFEKKTTGRPGRPVTVSRDCRNTLIYELIKARNGLFRRQKFL